MSVEQTDQHQLPRILESTYRAVVAADVLRLVELREDILCEHLAELHVHLIYPPKLASIQRGGRGAARTEGVDDPDDTLREDLVLVERNERTERRRGEFGEDDAVTRAVALEHLRLQQRL